MLTFVRVLFLCCIPLVFTFPAQAETEPELQDTLPELVVTATAEPAPSKDLPVHVQVITREEIVRIGAQSLNDVLIRNHPGYFYNVPGITSVGIRGFRSSGFGAGPDIKNRTLILIDGHRAGIGNISLIPVDNVERIEVVRGPGSVLYGASAIGGVINVITRKGEGPPRAVIGGEYGSFDHTLLRGGYSASTPDDRFGLAVAGRSFSRNDYSVGNNGSTLDNSAYQDQAISLGMRFQPSPDHQISAAGSSFKFDADAPGDLNDPFKDPEASTEENHQYASLAYDGASPDGAFTWRASGYTVRHDYAFISPQQPLTEKETITRGGRLQATVPTFAIGRLTFGGEYDRIEDRHEAGAFSPDTNYDIYALFAEERLSINRLTLYFGGRYDWYLEETLETEGLLVSPDQESFEHASWRGGAVYDPFDWMSLRAAVGTGFRPPVADELAGNFIISNNYGTYTYRGNPDLEAETSITYETGLDIFLENLDAGTTLFHTLSRDTIVTEGLPSGVTTYQNIEGITLTGIEGYARYRYGFHGLGGEMTVSPYLNWVYYLERRNEDEESASLNGTRTPFYIPDLSFTAGVNTSWNERVSFDLNAVYTGNQKVRNTVYPNYSSVIEDKDPFTILFASIRYTPTENILLSFRVENLLDDEYEFVDGYPMPGRTFIAGLEFSF